MKLKSCKKLPCGRCVEPEETVERLESIIGNLYDYRMYEEKVSDLLYWSALFIDGLEFRSMGKGTSAVQSKAGALAEGAEWLTSRQIHLLAGYVTGRQDQISNALRIEDLLVHTTVTPEILEKVKDTHTAHYWVDGYSLINGRKVKVPFEFVRLISGPSGVAAGNTIEEAIVHASTEVIERRAHITVLRNRMVLPTVDIDTIDNEIVRGQIDFLKSKQIEIIIKDLSFGGRLPCIGAYFFDPNIPEEYQFHHFFKVGTSFNREEALIRCFTEYTQGRRHDEFVMGSEAVRERVLGDKFRNLKCIPQETGNYLSAYTYGMVPYVNAEFLKEGEVVPFEKGDCFDDCLDDINACKEVFGGLGLDYVVVDLTDPEIGFPVAQVIVPGYSDVLPFHPATSPVLFRQVTKTDILEMYKQIEADAAGRGK